MSANAYFILSGFIAQDLAVESAERTCRQILSGEAAQDQVI